MNGPTFCDACKAKVEWHVTAAGRSMPIDPEPHDEGRFYFGAGLKLTSGAPGTRRRMYRCHWDTCAKGAEASKRGLKAASPTADQCERWNCEEEGRHLHCFKCGSTEHFANECESGGL